MALFGGGRRYGDDDDPYNFDIGTTTSKKGRSASSSPSSFGGGKAAGKGPKDDPMAKAAAYLKKYDSKAAAPSARPKTSRGAEPYDESDDPPSYEGSRDGSLSFDDDRSYGSRGGAFRSKGTRLTSGAGASRAEPPASRIAAFDDPRYIMQTDDLDGADDAMFKFDMARRKLLDDDSEPPSPVVGIERPPAPSAAPAIAPSPPAPAVSSSASLWSAIAAKQGGGGASRFLSIDDLQSIIADEARDLQPAIEEEEMPIMQRRSDARPVASSHVHPPHDIEHVVDDEEEDTGLSPARGPATDGAYGSDFETADSPSSRSPPPVEASSPAMDDRPVSAVPPVPPSPPVPLPSRRVVPDDTSSSNAATLHPAVIAAPGPAAAAPVTTEPQAAASAPVVVPSRPIRPLSPGIPPGTKRTKAGVAMIYEADSRLIYKADKGTQFVGNHAAVQADLYPTSMRSAYFHDAAKRSSKGQTGHLVPGVGYGRQGPYGTLSGRFAVETADVVSSLPTRTTITAAAATSPPPPPPQPATEGPQQAPQSPVAPVTSNVPQTPPPLAVPHITFTPQAAAPPPQVVTLGLPSELGQVLTTYMALLRDQHERLLQSRAHLARLTTSNIPFGAHAVSPVINTTPPAVTPSKPLRGHEVDAEDEYEEDPDHVEQEGNTASSITMAHMQPSHYRDPLCRLPDYDYGVLSGIDASAGLTQALYRQQLAGLRRHLAQLRITAEEAGATALGYRYTSLSGIGGLRSVGFGGGHGAAAKREAPGQKGEEESPIGA